MENIAVHSEDLPTPIRNSFQPSPGNHAFSEAAFLRSFNGHSLPNFTSAPRDTQDAGMPIDFSRTQEGGMAITRSKNFEFFPVTSVTSSNLGPRVPFRMTTIPVTSKSARKDF